MSDGDQVHLVIPVDPAYGRVARITAAHLALRRGFTLPEIDDLRLVMDEATAMMLPVAGPGELDLSYQISRDTIAIRLRLVPSRDNGRSPLPISAERVATFSSRVGDLVDAFSIRRSAGELTLTKIKATTQDQ